MKTVEAWWFAAPDKDGKVLLPHGDGREVKAGEKLTVAGKIVPCEHGLHASVRAIDALEYSPGATICRVRLSGTIVEHGGDKLAASERTVLWMADATRTLHEFAVWVARQALLRERKRGREPDKRSWEALRVKALWIRGKATDAELDAARDAARAAAWDAASAARAAAWDAAGDAAWDAARAAAWDAAGAAARDAARDAVRAAAWAAAGDAAWDAASAAAWAAARDAANKRLESMLNRLPKRKRAPAPERSGP
jgi:hypothetical protein